MSRHLIVTVALALAAGPAVALVPAQHDWKAYINARFTYSMCFPADLLKPEPEAPNGDGRRFEGKDGAVMLTYGSNNALGTSPAAAARAAGARLRGTAGKVSYVAVKRGWFVVSGNNGSNDFYAKSLYADGVVKSFELTYPASRAAVWAPVVDRLNACFHGTAR